VSLKNVFSIHSHHWRNFALSKVLLDFSSWHKGTLIDYILLSHTPVLNGLVIEGSLTCSPILIHISCRLRLINCLTHVRHFSAESVHSSRLGQGLSKVNLDCIAVSKVFQHISFSPIKISSLQYS
jgi:hypothetical protein